MKVHLYVDLQVICPIGWADAQELLGYMIVTGKAARSNPEVKSLGILPLRAHASEAMHKKMGHFQKGYLVALAFSRQLLTNIQDKYKRLSK
jgi:hypothetical protein